MADKPKTPVKAHPEFMNYFNNLDEIEQSEMERLYQAFKSRLIYELEVTKDMLLKERFPGRKYN